MAVRLRSEINRDIIKVKQSFAIMSRERVQHILSQLKRIRRLKDNDRKKFLDTCDKDIIHCICECAKNLLKGHIPLKTSHLKSLARHKRLLRKLAVKKTSLIKRRKILQTGGFFHMLMPALLNGLSGLVTNLINNASR